MGCARIIPVKFPKPVSPFWKQFKETREANPGRKVTLDYYPAAIYVNRVIVADAFPEWYQTLIGNNVVTGVASSSGARPRDLSSTINARPLNLSMNGADLTANSDLNITNSRMSTQSNVSSQNRMDEGGRHFPLPS